MIHYHGTPITPNTAALAAIGGGHAFVSFSRPDQIGMALDCCQSFAVDNGAFSAWRTGNQITEWARYYLWIADLHRCPTFDFAVIPDVIDGDEQANDKLLAEWPWQSAKDKSVGAPVWHMHESVDRLVRLATEWPRVCLGSSGEFSVIGNSRWWGKMGEAMNAVCDKQGLPICKLHGLRMLDTDVFSRLPFSSADSTNIAQNVGIDSRWSGLYSPSSKDVRATVLRTRIEAFQSAPNWAKVAVQERMFDEAAS